MKIISYIIALFTSTVTYSQTFLLPTNEKFSNGEEVYVVRYNGKIQGQFWPIRQMNLVTNQTNPSLFQSNMPLDSLQQSLKGVATAPDGMTTGSISGYTMQGKSLVNGIACGDGVVYNYGIIVIEYGNISFTHKQEIPDYDVFYQLQQARKNTLFFLPSIYRNGRKLSSVNTVDKVLIRRETHVHGRNAVQIGIIIFNHLISYDEVYTIVLGLDRKSGSSIVSQTTHIYVLDGGNIWGQACKQVNNSYSLVGNRSAKAVTNYLVLY